MRALKHVQLPAAPASRFAEVLDRDELDRFEKGIADLGALGATAGRPQAGVSGHRGEVRARISGIPARCAAGGRWGRGAVVVD